MWRVDCDIAAIDVDKLVDLEAGDDATCVAIGIVRLVRIDREAIARHRLKQVRRQRFGREAARRRDRGLKQPSGRLEGRGCDVVRRSACRSHVAALATCRMSVSIIAIMFERIGLVRAPGEDAR